MSRKPHPDAVARYYPHLVALPFCLRGCTSHEAIDHQGDCGHCGAAEDLPCEPGCPVDGGKP